MSDAVFSDETGAVRLKGTLTGAAASHVLSVFGRTGAVIADVGDYAVAQITGLAAALAAKQDTPVPQADVTGLTAALGALQALSGKGAANGYAGLDANGLVPFGQLQSANEHLSGNFLNIANFASVDLPWNSHDFGATLLNRATPDTPRVITSGVYAVSVTVLGSNLTVGGAFGVTLILGTTQARAQSPPATGLNDTPVVSMSLTAFVAANAPLTVTVTNLDSALARNFKLGGASVQKLT